MLTEVPIADADSKLIALLVSHLVSTAYNDKVACRDKHVTLNTMDYEIYSINLPRKLIPLKWDWEVTVQGKSP